MKRRINILICLLVLSVNLFSQNCSEELLAEKPGTWKAGMKGSTPNVSAADLVKEKAVLANIHKMISAGYTPKGCQVTYSNAFSGADPGAGKNSVADNFWYSMYILRYLCDQQSSDKSKYYVDISTTTTVTVNANAIWSLNNLFAADLPDDDFRGYLKMKAKPQIKDGFWYMGEEVVGDGSAENKTIEYRWLITYDEKLPFSYVSRKEFLLIQKKRLEKTMKDDQSSSDYYKQFMKNINDALTKSEEDLNMPAICKWNDEERFTGFVEEGTKGSFFAVKPDLSYYNKKLPKSAPQFFYLVYTLAHGYPVFEENIAAIQKAVDFNSLKAMLGK